MSVLNTIKGKIGKIVNVHQDISESLRSLTNVSSQKKSLDVEKPPLEISASVALLSRYQMIWAQLHQTSDDLAQNAQFVDGLVTNLFQYIDQQNTALKQFTSEMTDLVQLISDVNTAKNKIVNLQGAFSELESLLVEFEDICDETHLMKTKDEHKNELQKYKENKNKELEQTKACLASKHAEKVRKYEDQLKATLKERQKVFEEAFREQMIKYVTTGQVDYVPSSPHSHSDLSEIEIEQDRDELDRFLGATEDSNISTDKTTYNFDSDTDNEFELVNVLKDEDCSIYNISGINEQSPCGATDASKSVVHKSTEEKT